MHYEQKINRRNLFEYGFAIHLKVYASTKNVQNPFQRKHAITAEKEGQQTVKIPIQNYLFRLCIIRWLNSFEEKSWPASHVSSAGSVDVLTLHEKEYTPYMTKSMTGMTQQE